jgi:hypothetical protein
LKRGALEDIDQSGILGYQGANGCSTTPSRPAKFVELRDLDVNAIEVKILKRLERTTTRLCKR